MFNRAFVSLGSNINKERNLPLAVRFLSRLCNVVAVSEVYETIPVGTKRQPHFWNAAALVETALDAVDFRREVLERVERRLKRVRTTDPNAPRTIDADLILFNDEVFELDADHPIPDPDLLRFPHVAIPMADLDPHLRHPVTGEKLMEIAIRLVEKAGVNHEGRSPIQKRPDVDLRAYLSRR